MDFEGLGGYPGCFSLPGGHGDLVELEEGRIGEERLFAHQREDPFLQIADRDEAGRVLDHDRLVLEGHKAAPEAPSATAVHRQLKTVQELTKCIEPNPAHAPPLASFIKENRAVLFSSYADTFCHGGTVFTYIERISERGLSNPPAGEARAGRPSITGLL